MTRHVLLINPYPEDSQGINEATVYPPIGLAYLASSIRESLPNITVEILDANILKIPNNKVMDFITDRKPFLVGIHLNVVLGKSGIELSKLIKEEFGQEINVVIGGPLASSNPREILEQSRADVVVIGEGERTIVEIITGIDYENINGIGLIYQGSYFQTPPRALTENLDNIPFPAYDLLPDFNLYKSRARQKPVGVIITSRGCPFQCTFCNSNIFGKRFRARSPENVFKEILLLVKDYKIKQLDILDDNFTLDMPRAEKILDLIIESDIKIHINLQNGVRADRLTRELVHKMKLAGVFKAGIGIESGDREILARVKKSLDLENVRTAIQWFREENIITIGFLILGFPFDTKESIEETINFVIEANPTLANFCILIPFPGTELYNEMLSKGQLKDNNVLFYNSGFYANQIYHKCDNLTEQELLDLQNKAYKKFNFRPSKALEIIFTIKSWNEFKWTTQAALPLLKNMVS